MALIKRQSHFLYIIITNIQQEQLCIKVLQRIKTLSRTLAPWNVKIRQQHDKENLTEQALITGKYITHYICELNFQQFPVSSL